MILLVYVLLVYAWVVKRNLLLRPYLIYIAALVAILHLVTSLNNWRTDRSLGRLFQDVFINFDGTAPIQLFSTFALVPFAVLVMKEFGPIRMQLTGALNRIRIHLKSAGTILALVFASIVVLLICYIDFQSTKDAVSTQSINYDAGFQWTLFWYWPIGLIQALLQVAIFSLVFVLFYMTAPAWAKEISQLLGQLKDFRFNDYITRKIAGYIYGFYVVLAVGIFAVVVPMQTYTVYGYLKGGYEGSFHPQFLAIFPAGFALGLIAGALFVLVLRLVMEISVALVHIAQNTSRR